MYMWVEQKAKLKTEPSLWFPFIIIGGREAQVVFPMGKLEFKFFSEPCNQTYDMTLGVEGLELLINFTC